MAENMAYKTIHSRADGLIISISQVNFDIFLELESNKTSYFIEFEVMYN